MDAFCDDFHGCPPLETVGREGWVGVGTGRTRLQMQEERRERQTKRWMFCTDGKEGELKVPKQNLRSGLSP